jgi:hypothetical protein
MHAMHKDVAFRSRQDLAMNGSVKNKKAKPMPRMHWLMYGLYYPAILGTAIVFTLQHLATGKVEYPVFFVALTAGAFFSISFGSAFNKEEEYSLAPFLLDALEIFEMIVCFLFLKLVDPIPNRLEHYLPFLPGAYLTLMFAVVVQLEWRRRMGLRWNAFIDLKSVLLVLLALGALLGEHFRWLNWVITILFSLTSIVYVLAHPYETHARKFFFGQR